MGHENGSPGRDDQLARAQATIRKLRAELAAERGSHRFAIVGAGLRFPGGIHDLDGYWQALAEGRDVVKTMPEGRYGPFADEWRAPPRRGGLFDDVLDFDAPFFGIGSGGARALDPQHRLALEVVWEALEDAALPPDRVDATR